MISTQRRQFGRVQCCNGLLRRGRAVARTRGVTLTEVLMAMLIAGIGLVTVATLFPIAILRSVQATQLTNATTLRYNAEARIDIYPDIVHNPDGIDANNNGTPYDEHFGKDYVVDPLGWWTLSQDYASQPNLTIWFGNDGQQPTPNPINTGRRRLRRYSGGTANESIARALVMLDDSWALQFEDVPAAVTGIAAQLPSTFDVSNFAAADSRIVFFDSRNGRTGQIRGPLTISSLSPPVLSWTVPLPLTLNEDRNGNGNLDAGEDANGNNQLDNYVGRIRVETQEQRYTWLLTVRKNGFGDANIDIVVFFRRTFSLEDERMYYATFVAGQREAYIVVPSGENPFLKKGGFVLDTANARWYRILDIKEVTGPYQRVLTLDRRILETAGEDRNLNGALDTGEDTNNNNNLDFGGAIFMRGVVEVYPIGTRTFPRDLLTGP